MASTGSQPQTTVYPDETAVNTPAQELGSGAPKGLKCTCMAPVDAEGLVPVESDSTLLSIYRKQLSDSFPFVVIAADTTPTQLQTNRPFLMKVIRMAASVRHLPSMRAQSRTVMEHISNAVLLRSERSLDLLQGILALLGFYHYHCLVHAQFNNLVRIAVSVCEDLDLGTCSSSQRIRSQVPLVGNVDRVCRTNEQKRALLAVWYMSSK